MIHHQTEAIRRQFGQNAQSYVSSPLHAKGQDLEKLLAISGLSKMDVVLDVATGGGHVANALAPYVQQVMAYDLTLEILEAAKRFVEGNGHSNVQFVQGDAEKMPFDNEFFYAVTCRLAAHHFSEIDFFLKETSRVLKSGGQFLLIDNVSPEENIFDDFYNHVEKVRDYSHFRAWKKSEWVRMLEEHDFEINEQYCFPKTFIFNDWCQRMNVPSDVKELLNSYMLNASGRIKNKFRIEEKHGEVLSFRGEAVLIKATKCNF